MFIENLFTTPLSDVLFEFLDSFLEFLKVEKINIFIFLNILKNCLIGPPIMYAYTLRSTIVKLAELSFAHQSRSLTSMRDGGP